MAMEMAGAEEAEIESKVTSMNEAECRQTLKNAMLQMKADQATIKQLRVEKLSMAGDQIDGLIVTLAGELVDAVEEVGKRDHVFNTASLSTYTHLKFLSSFENCCPLLIKVIVGAVICAMSRLLSLGKRKDADQYKNLEKTMAENMDVAIEKAKENNRLMTMLSTIFACFFAFLIGSSFQWEFAWSICITINTIAKSTMIFDILGKVIPGAPGSMVTFNECLLSIAQAFVFPAIYGKLDIICGYDNTSIGYVLGMSRMMVQQSSVVTLRLVMFIYGSYDENYRTLQSQSKNAPGTSNWQPYQSCHESQI